MNLSEMVERGVTGRPAGRKEALELLAAPDDLTIPIVAAAGRVRRHFFGNRVRLNYLVSLKSGLCPEDCSYCSQRLGSTADIMTYSWADADSTRDAVEAGIAAGARRVCLVASGHGPSNREIDRVCATISGLKAAHPGIEVCVCLGFVDDAKAAALSAAGADAYNHNANTSRSHYAAICSTHTYEDRMDTLEVLRRNGLSPCSGVIAGMGESDADLVDVIADLRARGVDSVPVNFLLPFEGTPLAGLRTGLSPQRCLRILSMVRFIHPDVEVRAAAGREMHLGVLQPLALEVANSIFLGDYLTSEGAAGATDLRMIREAGFLVEGADDQCDTAAAPRVPPRRRGVGSELPANA